jgi:isopenicillin N synthase-like dioxygenase
LSFGILPSFFLSFFFFFINFCLYDLYILPSHISQFSPLDDTFISHFAPTHTNPPTVVIVMDSKSCCSKKCSSSTKCTVTKLSVGAAAVAAIGAASYWAYKKFFGSSSSSSSSSASSSSASAVASSQPLPVRFLESNPDVVVVSYEDLVNGRNLSASLQAAFGESGLGLITISGVPNVTELRQKMHHTAREFALLPDAIKEKYAHAKSKYNFGWSHGKEKFLGKPDVAKGSYYANPIHDDPFDNNQEFIDQYPSFAHPNIWPTEDFPQLEPIFKAMGGLVVEVGALLAEHCDRYVKSIHPSYPENLLSNTIRQSRTHKARMLHYFPRDDVKDTPSVEDVNEGDLGSWCGWHNDHGSLTGLVPAMYFDKEGNEISCPDPTAGLYVRTRVGRIVRASVPKDHLAFQMGECEQLLSGGVLQATPHCVRAASGPDCIGMSRETLAVFMEPEWGAVLNIPADTTYEQATLGQFNKELPAGVPPLETRYEIGIDFGDFTNRTLNEFH